MSDSRRVPLIFSTDALPEAHRFEALREMFASGLARVDVTAPDVKEVRATAIMRPLNELRLIEFDVGPVSFTRTKELLRDGDDGFTLVICTGGGFDAVNPEGDGATIRSGMAALVSHRVTGGTRTHAASTEMSLVLPRNLLGQAVRDPDRVVGAPPPGGFAALGLLIHYVRCLAQEWERLPANLAGLVEAHLLDLVAQAYDPAGQWARAAAHDGVRTARRRRLLELLAERFSNPDASPASFATALGVSPRQVHSLLEDTGRTFSEHLREHRLQAARRMLKSPRFAGWRVIDIALEAGFSDLSYFNRNFRRRFGGTPQSFRPGRADG